MPDPKERMRLILTDIQEKVDEAERADDCAIELDEIEDLALEGLELLTGWDTYQEKGFD